MFALLSRHFHGVEREVFLTDLREKSHVVLLEDANGRLWGFSTFLYYRTQACGRMVSVIYSGDTIVDRAAWGSPALPLAWIEAMLALRGEDPELDCYWLLLTSGFRTYRFLRVFLKDFYPRYDREEEPSSQALLVALCRERFGERFDPVTGLVRFASPQRLREGLVDVPEGRRADPHVRFFLERNPGHDRGDELASLGLLADANLTAAALRMVRR